MPKERRGRSLSSDRSRASPFPCGSSRARRSSSKNPLEPVEDAREWEEARQSSSKKPLEPYEDLKEWEEARCPVCMEHPHNAVMLLCSSRDKGCHPFMCDTSYRHSNCLDQFRKAFAETPSTMEAQEETLHSNTVSHLMPSEMTPSDMQEEINEQASNSSTVSCESQLQPKLVCPLCRGHINGWVVVEPARQFMNAKVRSCACETCDFTGTYIDLRKHARLEHPCVRPSEADPERQRDWRRLERQRDLGDVLSTIQSAFGEERSEDDTFSVDEGGWLTVFFLIRVFRPGTSSGSSWSGGSRVRGQPRSRRRTLLWGESYDIGTGSALRQDENGSLEDMSHAWRRRERSRSRRRTSPDNEP